MTVHILYIYRIYTVYTQYIHSIYTVHTLYIYSIYSVYILKPRCRNRLYQCSSPSVKTETGKGTCVLSRFEVARLKDELYKTIRRYVPMTTLILKPRFIRPFCSVHYMTLLP